jgi:hypothetical protein
MYYLVKIQEASGWLQGLKTEMPASKGDRHFVSTLFYQGDVQWENRLRRKRNRQNLL